MRVYFFALLSLFILPTRLHMETPPSSSVEISAHRAIHLITPVENFISHKPLILFKGNIPEAKEFFINGKKIDLEKMGRFYHKVELNQLNSYHHIVLEAIFSDGRKTSLTRKIYYRPSPNTPKPVSTQPSKSQSPSESFVDQKPVSKHQAGKPKESSSAAREEEAQPVTVEAAQATMNEFNDAMSEDQPRMVTKIIKLEPSRVKSTVKIIKQRLSSKEFVHVAEKNLIIINAEESKIHELLQLIYAAHAQNEPNKKPRWYSVFLHFFSSRLMVNSGPLLADTF